MTKTEIESLFSNQRMCRYFNQFPHDEAKCIETYILNKQLSESFYCSLAVLEITLRNKINQELSKKYKRKDWYTCWEQDPKMEELWQKINAVIKRLKEHGKPLTPDNIIAELTFGFWASLFNTAYMHTLWGQLRFVFPKMPKKQRKRNVISKKLNKVRTKVRNRVYHYEPIIWNKQIKERYEDIYIILNWIEPQLSTWLKSIDRFPTVYNNVRTSLPTLHP